MSTTSYLSERAKYSHILQMSEDQAKAIERNDFATFQRILTAKGALIASLRDGKRLIANDPSLLTVVLQIQASELYTEKLLYNRLGMIKRKLTDFQKFKTARNAYRRGARKLPSFVPSTETPRLFDKAS